MSGELLSLLVALMWTFTALFAEVASKRLGALTLNVWRMILSILLLGLTLWVFCGSPLPRHVPLKAWGWLLGSGFMGFVFGDYCLFNSYLLIGSRFGQLFMTLASPFAAITAWLLLGEHMTGLALLGMLVTLLGIGISILGKDDGGHRRVKLPLRGVLLGIGAGLGQGVGLVFSKVGLQAYEAALPAGADDVQMMLPFAGAAEYDAPDVARPSRRPGCCGHDPAGPLPGRQLQPAGRTPHACRSGPDADGPYARLHPVARPPHVRHPNHVERSPWCRHRRHRSLTLLPLSQICH